MKLIDCIDEVIDELIADCYTAWQLTNAEVGSYDMRFSEVELEVLMAALIRYKWHCSEKKGE